MKNKYNEQFKQEVMEFYKNHSIQETKNKYKISVHSILTWADKNKLEKTKENQRNFYNRIKANIDYLKKRTIKNKNNYSNNKELIKEKNHKRYIKYSKKYIQQNKEWYRLNKPKIMEYYKRKQRHLYKNDPNHKIKVLLRTRIYIAMKSFGTKKSAKTQELIGCSAHQFKEHIESQFRPGMTWENYGKWHIDHIKPCSSFNLSDPEEQKKCFNYMNLQPLWAVDNLKKSNKII